MKKLFALLFILQITTAVAFAQNHGRSEGYDQQNILRAGLLMLEHESILAPNTTLVSRVGVAFSGGYGGRHVGWLFDYYPMIGISPRYYYNLDERARDGKDTRYFSGNYVSFFTRIYLNKIAHQHESNEYLFGPVWGIQRNLGHFQYGLHAGAGIRGPVDDLKVVPLLGLKFAYRF